MCLAAFPILVVLVWWFRNESAKTYRKVRESAALVIVQFVETMTGIKDAASATAALPKLTELSGKLDDMTPLVDKLPAAEKGKITDLINTSLAKVEDQFAKLQWMPGLGDKVQPAIEGIMGKLASIGGLPTPQLPKLSGDLAGAFSSLTQSLSGIKDAASAEAAMPKLAEISGKLDGAKAAMDKLSDSGKDTLMSMLKPALAKLKELADKVMSLAGVGDKIKPVLDSITAKLDALAA